jgi:broad specificity phosphatase PhoE
MNAKTVFYVVRHGETVWNIEDRVQGGEGDSPLTEKGIAQARETAEKLKHVHFDMVFSSDLLRAQKTAEIIALEHKLAVNTNRMIRERSYGPYSGLLKADYKKENREALERYQALSGEEKRKFKIRDYMEADEEVMARAITFLREIAVAYPGKTILVVAHGGIMRMLLIHLGFGTYEELSSGVVKNGGYVKLASDGVEVEVLETAGIEKKA